jgi:carbohydrate-selective porin OprB
MILGMLVLFCAQNTAFGAGAPTNDELLKEILELRKIIKRQNVRIGELEEKVSGQPKTIDTHKQVIDQENMKDLSGRRREELERLRDLGGLEIGAGATFVGQGTPEANHAAATGGATVEDPRSDGSVSVDIEIAKAFDERGMAFLLLEYGSGAGLTDELSLFSNVNYDATGGASLDVIEAWYEQYLFDRQLTITGGQLDPAVYIDTNEYANDECTQFLSDMFRNSAAIDFPDGNAWGGRIYIAPEALDFLEVEALYMEENADWEGLFDDPFIAAQVNFMPAKVFGYDEEMRGGNYRAYIWYNGAPHAKLKDPDVVERGKVGFGFSCDQKITDVFGVFGRFGWADPAKSDLGYDWSIGARMTGRYWNREDDVVAAAIGQAVPGGDYRDVNEFDNAETHLETYYAFKVNDHLTLSPDMQIIWDPNGGGISGSGNSGTIFVYGIRAQVDL